MSDITSWERSAANNNSSPPDGAPEGMAPSTVNNTMREMMAAVARNRRQYTGTDSGTDAYQFDGNGDLATDDVVDIDIGSANTTATPTLENTGGAPAGAQSIVTTQGAAFIGMLEARPHRFLWDGTNFVVLDPAGGVVDKGSNSNGDYVRFADGTQICDHGISATLDINNSGGGLNFSADQTWTYPASFLTAGEVEVSFQERNATVVWAQARSRDSTTADWLALRVSSTTGQPVVVSALAIGRWK